VAAFTLPPVAVSGQQIELPHVAKPVNVVPFQPKPATVTSIKSTDAAATRGKKATKGRQDKGPVVEAVKASRGTWAFRLRWNSLPNRPVEYITRVTDETYNLIIADKEMYERYKRQILQIATTSAVPAGNGTRPSATGTI
jgi:hypothetical protein